MPSARRSRLLAVAPIPPPVDGRAVASGWLVDAIASSGVTVTVMDVQFPGRTRRVRKMLRCMAAALRILVAPPEVVLVVASGDAGILAELWPLVASRIRRRPVLVTHHSAACVRSRTRLMAVAVATAGGRATYVLLTPGMCANFAHNYGLAHDRCFALSNAASMPVPDQPSTTRARSVVHLSNLHPEKGSVVAVQIAERLDAADVASPILTLAGPPHPDVTRAVHELRPGVSVAQLGAVGTPGKYEVLAGHRVMLFPTQFRLESEPLVVFEAAAVGTVPVVWGMGWLTEQMAALGLARFVIEPGDVQGLVDACDELLGLDDDEFEALSSTVRAAFLSHRTAQRARLEELLLEGSAR
jgi:glycosyltransferase involved in cell wall biosynthesis